MNKRVGLFGWGIVAPKSPNVAAFRKNLETSESWLTPFEGFGPNNFLVGEPEFNFDDYRDWIDSRFAPRHFRNLKEKMDAPCLYAIGAFIQALAQNPELEQLLSELRREAHVYIGTGLGAIDTCYRSSLELHEAQTGWNAFWAKPQNNSALAEFLEGNREQSPEIPPCPESVRETEGDEASATWNAFWTARSPELQRYLAEAAAIDGLAIHGEVENGKLNVIRKRSKLQADLQENWQCPEPPWKVSANLIWNIHNTPASQVSILAKTTGLAFAPVAACSTFGVALHLAMRAIRMGNAKVVIVGATDPPPHPLTVGSFYCPNCQALDSIRLVSQFGRQGKTRTRPHALRFDQGFSHLPVASVQINVLLLTAYGPSGCGSFSAPSAATGMHNRNRRRLMRRSFLTLHHSVSIKRRCHLCRWGNRLLLREHRQRASPERWRGDRRAVR